VSPSVFELVTEAVERALDDPNPLLASLTPAAGLPAERAELLQATADVAASGDLADWIVDAAGWRDALEDVADAAFDGQDRLDRLLLRTLQSRAPRVAALLSIFGVLTSTPDGGQDIHWDRLREVLTSADTVVNESLWDELLAGFGQPGDGRRIAILVALLILAPQTIAALVNDDLSIAPLVPPPTRSGGDWQAFRQRTADWLSVTLPIGDPTSTTPVPRSLFDWASGVQPDFPATVAGRTSRVAAGAGHRTDFEVWIAFGVEGDEWELDLGDAWILRVAPGVTVGFGRVEGAWHGAFRQFLVDASRVPGPSDPIEVTVRRDPPGGAEDVLLGPPYDTRLELRDVLLFLRVREQSPIAEIGFDFQDLALVITNRWFRTFGVSDTVFREGIRFDADVRLAWVEGEGFQFNLGSALETVFVIEKRFGPQVFGVKLHDIRLRVPIEVAAGELRIRGEIRLHASIEVGTFLIATVDGPGAWGGFWKDMLGDPASERYYFGFLPPTGAGVQLKFPPITGGGYLERKELATGAERWGGVLTLGLAKFSVTALGIWERQVSGDTSFIAVLGVRFPGGIQLGFGFSITGIGGILGLDRRVDFDALRERLTSGAAGNVLFLEDPITSAPTIIGDLGAMFPAQEGVVVAGPTFQLSWVNMGATSFAKVDIGLVFEFTGPALTRVLLLGSLRAETPGKIKDKPLLHLRLDIVGLLDLPKQALEFDATLIESKALEVFHLTGDAAFRSSWSDANPYVLLSIGGFHPRFDPSPIVVPDLTRVALTQTVGFFGAGTHLRFEAYLAVTSNTFQLGARVEAGWKLGPLNAIGFLAFDALVEFQPFYFDIAFSAGMAIRWNDRTLAGVKVVGTLCGPGPTLLKGRACIEILFFDICASGEIPIGSDNQPAPPPSVEPVDAAGQALTADNLRGEGGDAYVRLLPVDTVAGEALVAPTGELVWSQTRLPLDVQLDFVDGQPVSATQAVVALSPAGRGPVDEWFAPGRYLELTESEALSRPAFERLPSGLVLGFDERAATGSRTHTIVFETIRLPRRVAVRLPALALAGILLEAVGARVAAPGAAPGPVQVTVSAPGWSVYGTGGTEVVAGRTASDAFTRARTSGDVAVADGDVVEVGAF
jgi:Family of unknown function (DUF6603)